MFQLLTTLTFAVMAVSGSTAFVTRRQSEGPSGGPPPPGIPAGSPPFLPPTELTPLHVVECANPTTMENFDKTKYIGDWYQYEGYPTYFSPSGTKCVRVSYGANDNGTVSVRNIATKVDGSFTDICGVAVTEDPSVPGSLTVTLTGTPPGPYQVLHTDYDNFAVVYACSDTPFGKLEYMWVLTRAREPTQESVDEAHKVLAEKGISLEKSELMDQGAGCSYEQSEGIRCDKKE